MPVCENDRARVQFAAPAMMHALTMGSDATLHSSTMGISGRGKILTNPTPGRTGWTGGKGAEEAHVFPPRTGTQGRQELQAQRGRHKPGDRQHPHPLPTPPAPHRTLSGIQGAVREGAPFVQGGGVGGGEGGASGRELHTKTTRKRPNRSLGGAGDGTYQRLIWGSEGPE